MIFGFKAAPAKEKQEPQQASLATRLRQGLQRTQSTLLDGLGDLFLGKQSIDEGFLETLEERLLIADLGVNATTKIIDALSDRLKRSEKQDPAILRETLNQLMCEILQPVNQLKTCYSTTRLISACVIVQVQLLENRVVE